MFIARNLVFYPGYFDENCQELSDEIILPTFYLNRIIDHFDNNETLYVDITNIDKNLTTIVTIGTAHSYDKNIIYAPQWILDLIGCSGNCDSAIKIKKADMTTIPSATKIVIKPLDPIAFDIDTRACFENAFMNLHSIKENITMSIPVPQFGKNFTMFAYIEKVEPASTSRITAGDVDVEFINEFNNPIIPQSNLNNMENITDTNTNTNTDTNTDTNVDTVTDTVADTVTDTIEEISPEERRRQVRESWLRRYQNNEEQQ
jgi:hypothetical protein